MTDDQITITRSSVQSLLTPKIETALQDAVDGIGRLPESLLSLQGMSGRKYRLFVNNLISLLDDARYLEVGILTGSTLCAAMFENRVMVTAVENWSQFGAPKQRFQTNPERFRGPEAEVNIIERDFREVDFSIIGKFDVYLYDGPHGLQDQRDGIELALPALDREFVLIVDDWNWRQVREGTMSGIERLGLQIAYRVDIRTTLDNSHGKLVGPAGDWHNGYFLASVVKA